jgi:hypothetical protein
MINLITGGHYVEKGHYYRLYMTFPEFSNSKTISMHKDVHKSTKINFVSCFLLTRSPIYFNIVLRLFGFGIGLEIQSRT